MKKKRRFFVVVSNASLVPLLPTMGAWPDTSMENMRIFRIPVLLVSIKEQQAIHVDANTWACDKYGLIYPGRDFVPNCVFKQMIDNS